jgi:hypothetical protein
MQASELSQTFLQVDGKSLHNTSWSSSHPCQHDMSHIEPGCWTIWCSWTHCGSLAQGSGTPSAWRGADPQINGGCGRQCRTRPMRHDDQQVGRRCRKPTKLQLSLSVVAQHTESSGTLCSGVVQTWTLWCEANCLPPRGQSHRHFEVRF